MPLSFRRSFKKIPGAHLDENKRRLGRAASVKAVRPSEEFRPTKYPLVIPIGCGAAIGLCLFVLFSRGIAALPSRPTAIPVDYAGIATSAFETALAQQLTTVEALRLTELPSPAASLTATASVPPTMAAANNPWAAEIPEAACIPADLPQTGRVVDVVDGDTIRVLLDGDGHVYSVRYVGVEAPQVGSGGAEIGSEAKRRNTALVFRRQAILVRDITDSDASGTLLRYVLADGVFVNYAMVSEGLATTSVASPDTACRDALLFAEQRARSDGLGMWAPAWDSTPQVTATP